MVEPPREDKRKAARRTIIEALAQAHPITAGLAHLYRFTHPTEMERAVEGWRTEISTVVNGHEARVVALEEKLFPRLIIHDAALAVALWLTKENPDGSQLGKEFSELESAFPEFSSPELEEACFELRHLGLVEAGSAIGHPVTDVSPTYELYWTFDPVVMGTEPESDARELARAVLNDEGLSVIARLDEAMGWPRRRLNPAVARLICEVPHGHISREIQNRYPTSSFAMTSESRFRLRRFAEEAPE